VRSVTEPENRPAPLEALALRAQPTELHFRRNHFLPPERPAAEVTVAGMNKRTFSLAELRSRAAAATVSAVLECAGHRRAELEPPAEGIPWELGAVSEARWSGLPLRELLLEVGVPPAARSVALYGRDGDVERFGRAISLEKALSEETLVAWEMNGEPVPLVHGGPLRAIVPGHYAVDSVKWLERIELIDGEFEGSFQRLDYRLFTADDDEGVELHALPVHALLLDSGTRELSGIAWGGEGGVASVAVSIDDGPWEQAELERTSRWGRVFWRHAWEAAGGTHTVAVRATDAAGTAQPDAPQWNRLGYANNSVRRVRITAP